MWYGGTGNRPDEVPPLSARLKAQQRQLRRLAESVTRGEFVGHQCGHMVEHAEVCSYCGFCIEDGVCMKCHRQQEGNIG